ncbi:MAG: YerC/YecD family TrpR-related protein [Candidatus Pacebacteria bacterium]|nr:YerC/YecD family TrpR-related protein [Candidatus Paceibacterota bacterium]
MVNIINEDIDELLLALVYIDNLKDMDNFISDLLTDTELEVATMRWKAVRMLTAGITYTKIGKSTGMSSATIARISKLLKKRTGGFKNMLLKMQ